MPDILVRNLDDATVERLKARARRHERSLQGEVKRILEAAATYSVRESLDVAREWQARLGDRDLDDSADLIRDDRDR